MICAVCPVAFYVQEHVGLTRYFVERLLEEDVHPHVFHNGGPFGEQGRRMLKDFELNIRLYDATGWPFYRMWNRGLEMLKHESVVLVLNNDIGWVPGALRELAWHLQDQPEDVAIASAAPGAYPTYCFAIRPDLAPSIDERYQTWFGDVELRKAIEAAGLRCILFDPGIVHPHNQTTTDHIPGIHDMRLRDQELFESRWGYGG